MNTSVIVFLGGIPGSGKSTFANTIYKGMPRVSSDDLRLHLTGSTADHSKDGQVWDIVHQKVAYYIRTNKAFVYDATNADGPKRRAMLQFMDRIGAECSSPPLIMGVFFDVALSTAKERNANRDRKVPEKVLERMHTQFFADPPSLKEGFSMLDFGSRWVY